MKIGKTLLVVCLAAISIFCFRPGYGSGIISDREALLAKAQESGRVRVIVTFSVSDLENLQKTSQAFKATPPGRARPETDNLKAKAADAALAGAIEEAGSKIFGELDLSGRIQHIFKTVPQALITADSREILALAGHPGVIRVTEDRLVPAPVSSPAVDDEKENTAAGYGVTIINAPRAWDKGYDGTGWYVAVLDTGVRTSHEMFTGKDIVEACFSSNTSDASSLCPGGVPEATGPGSAVPPDRFGHGSHVSGIAVGKQPNGSLSGVAPKADLIAIQVFSFIPSWWDVGSYISDQIKGLEYVYGLRTAHTISSVNMSLGDGNYDNYCDYVTRKPAIDQLRAAGIAVTISTGNDGNCGQISAPACISSAVAVGGSDYNDRPYYGNNWHPVMQDIFAPGVSIYSALATGDEDYGTKTGTSMAAPHVAGAWAIFRQIAPTAEVSEIESVMEQSGTPIESGCETEPSVGPRLDVAAVVDYYLIRQAVPTADAGPDQVVDEGATVTLDASASISHSGHGLTQNWVQTEGAGVTLSDPLAIRPTFDAPSIGTNGEKLVFEVTVTDDFNQLTDTDAVAVTVSDLDRYKPPTADAGPDQSVVTGTTVHLDGSASVSNSNAGADLSHAWVQTGGIGVTLSDPTDPAPTFVGPEVEGASTLEFELLVVDGFNDLSGSDSVLVTVNHIDNDVDPGFLPAVAHGGEIIGLKIDGEGALVSLTPRDPAGIEDTAGRPDVVAYLFETGIKCNPGATIQITFQLPRIAPQNAAWYGHRDTNGWEAFPVVWNGDRTKAAITIIDGGDRDPDGAADGRIDVISGLGYDSAGATGGRSGGGGCFLQITRE